jgi:malonate decarboxylase gamma subunit
VANYEAMGGIASLWKGDLQTALMAALADSDTTDRRAALGRTRGGRQLAQDVTQRVLAA